MEATERLLVILKVGNFSSIAGVHILITQVATIIREIAEVVIGYASLGVDIKCNKRSMNTIRRHIMFVPRFHNGTLRDTLPATGEVRIR